MSGDLLVENQMEMNIENQRKTELIQGFMRILDLGGSGGPGK